MSATSSHVHYILLPRSAGELCDAGSMRARDDDGMELEAEWLAIDSCTLRR